MRKLDLLNDRVKCKGYVIVKKTNSRFELVISTPYTGIVDIVGCVHFSKSLKDMEQYINARFDKWQDITKGTKYRCLNGLILPIEK